ncbi:hypothetical protein F5146DRAFT_1166506 [Armillaria mellea]|nr:hypothetical protein F5146DRAFT_1166506 [Armillaria mellea]
MFTSLELTDDEELLHSSSLPALGEISIEIWRVKKLAHSSFRGKSFAEVGKIHERSRKAIAHCVNHFQQREKAEPPGHLYIQIPTTQSTDIAPEPEPTPATRKRSASPDDVTDLSEDSDQEDNSLRIAELEEELLLLKKRDAKRAKPRKLNQERGEVRTQCHVRRGH